MPKNDDVVDELVCSSSVVADLMTSHLYIVLPLFLSHSSAGIESSTQPQNYVLGILLLTIFVEQCYPPLRQLTLVAAHFVCTGENWLSPVLDSSHLMCMFHCSPFKCNVSTFLLSGRKIENWPFPLLNSSHLMCRSCFFPFICNIFLLFVFPGGCGWYQLEGQLHGLQQAGGQAAEYIKRLEQTNYALSVRVQAMGNSGPSDFVGGQRPPDVF